MPRDLSRWPRLLVVGKRISQAQAEEILLRTDNWHLPTNDAAWVRAVCALAGMKLRYGSPDFASVRAFRERIGCLDLSYLNNCRIASNWTGGPHGWCDWSGLIQANEYNIGTNPHRDEVYEDWQRIAAEWPFLDLTAQLVPDNGTAGMPAVEYLVRGGRVVAHDEPKRLITGIGEPNLTAFFAAHGERGVSLPRLSRALRRISSAP